MNIIVKMLLISFLILNNISAMEDLAQISPAHQRYADKVLADMGNPSKKVEISLNFDAKTMTIEVSQGTIAGDGVQFFSCSETRDKRTFDFIQNLPSGKQLKVWDVLSYLESKLPEGSPYKNFVKSLNSNRIG